MSATQLERWRKLGLLPRASQAWRGKYGSTCSLPEGSVELATALGRHARRGRGWVDLALLAWLDGAPVKDAMLNRAIRAASRGLLQMAVETIEKERATNPVPDGMELDPSFETAEIFARLATRGPVRSRVQADRELQARLRASGYEVPEQPLRDMLTVTWAHLDDDNPMDPEEVERWSAAIGMSEKTPTPMGMASAAGWLLSRGLLELTGESGRRLFDRGAQQVLDGEVFLSRSELDAARADLDTHLHLLGIEEEYRSPATSHTLVAHFVAYVSALWALVRRQLPEGTGLVGVLRAGLQVAQNMTPQQTALAA